MEDLNIGLLGALEDQRGHLRSQAALAFGEFMAPTSSGSLALHLRYPADAATLAPFLEKCEKNEVRDLPWQALAAREDFDAGDRVVLIDLLGFAFLNGCHDAFAPILSLAESGEPCVEAEAALVTACLLGNKETVTYLNGRPATAARLRHFLSQDDVFQWFSLAEQALCGLPPAEAGLLGRQEVRRDDAGDWVFTWLRPYTPIDGNAVSRRAQFPELRRFLPLLEDCYSLSPIEKRMLDVAAGAYKPEWLTVLQEITERENQVTGAFAFERVRLTERIFALFQFCRVFGLEHLVSRLVDRTSGYEKKLDRWIERPSHKTLFLARRACAGMVYALRDMDHHRAEEMAEATIGAYNDLAQDDWLSENDHLAWFHTLATAAQATDDADEAFALVQKALDLTTRLAPYLDRYRGFHYVRGFTLSGAAEWCEDLEGAARLRAEAVAAYETVLRMQPGDAAALFGIAYEYGEDAGHAVSTTEQRRLRLAAVSRYREALSAKPTMGNAHYNWGNELFQLARLSDDETEKAEFFRDAARHYAECSEIRARDAASLEKCAAQLASIGREMTETKQQVAYIRQAIDLLVAVLALDPDRADICLLLGHHWDDLAEAIEREDICREYREQAIQRYTEATVLDPEEERGFFHLGYQKSCLASLLADWTRVRELRTEAIDHYRRAQELNPTMVLVHYNCAYEFEQLLSMSEDSEERRNLRLAALTEFDLFVRAEPNAGSGHFKLGYHLDESAFELDDPAACRATLERAVYHYQRALEVAAEDETTWYYLGLARIRFADFAANREEATHWLNEALGAFREAVRLNEHLHGALVGMACVFAGLAKLSEEHEVRRNYHQQAIVQYQTALILKPEEAEDLFQLGFQHESLARLCEETGDKRRGLLEAVGFYKKALGFQPGKIAAMAQWGAALAELAEICVDLGQKRAYHVAAAEKFRGVFRLDSSARHALMDWGNQLFYLAGLSDDGSVAQRLHRQALAVFLSALQQYPDDHFAAYKAGVQYAYLAHGGETKDHFDAYATQATSMFASCLAAPFDVTRFPYVGMAAGLVRLGEVMDDADFDRAVCVVAEQMFAFAATQPRAEDRLYFRWAYAVFQQVKRVDELSEKQTMAQRALTLVETHLANYQQDIKALELAALVHNFLADHIGDPEAQRNALNAALDCETKVLHLQNHLAEAYCRVGLQMARLAYVAESVQQARTWRNQAVSHFNKALGRDENHVESLIQLGATLGTLAGDTPHLERRRDLHFQAVSYFKRAAATGSRHPQIFYGLGHQLSHLAILAEKADQIAAHQEEARGYYEEAVRLNPQFFKAWLCYGSLLERIADASDDAEERRRLHHEALDKYRQGLVGDLQPFESLYNQSLQCELQAKLSDDAEEKRRYLEAARNYYREAWRLNPNHKEMIASAINCSLKLLKMAPDEDEGRALVSEAEGFINHLSELTGTPLSTNYNYACMLALGGKRREALQVLERCLTERAVWPRYVAQDPDWTGLHDEPEFARLIARFD